MNGQREQANNYTLDGIDMNEPIDNLLPYQPSPDALAEVRVETNNYSAEFGNVAGALIGSTIKSGTNEFHGSVFEYWRDSSMAANTWENNRVTPAAEKAELSQHIFGATIGGPIVRNKVFFFGDYQGFIRDRPGELVRSVAPGGWRRGDFSGRRRRPSAIRSTGQPFAGNIIPTQPVQPDRAGGARQPAALSAAQPVGEHEQPRRSRSEQAARPPGGRQGRLEHLDQRSHVRALLVPELQVGARTRAARKQPARRPTIRPSWAWPATGRAPWARTRSTSCWSASRT